MAGKCWTKLYKAGMARNCYKSQEWLKMDGYCWKRLYIAEIAKNLINMARNRFFLLLEMDVNGWKWLNTTVLAGNSWKHATNS